jgi:hypothetical protein
MIKSEIRSLIFNNLPKYEEILRFHPRVIDAVIEKALAEYYNLIFLRDPLELARYTKEFGYTVPIAVAYEGATHLYYSLYPYLTGNSGDRVSIIPIPDKSSGVRRISTIIQGGLTFYPMDARELDLVFGGHYVAGVTAKIGYVPRRTRVEYYDPNGVVTITTTVRMDLLIPFSNYLDTDTVLVPEIVNDQGLGFIDRVIQMFEKTPPVELVENKRIEEIK